MNKELRKRVLGGAGFVGGIVLVIAGCYTLFVLAVPSTVGFLILGVMLLVLCWQPMMPTRYPPLPLSPDEPDMQRASSQAQASISRFSDGLASQAKKGAVRIALDKTDGSQQRIWVKVAALNESEVRLLPRPVPAGATLPKTVPLLAVEDWLLVDLDGVTEGGFTHLAMAEKYRREEGYIPRGLRLELAKFVDGKAILNN